MNTSRPFNDALCAVQLRETVGIVVHDIVLDRLKLEPSDEDLRLLMHPRCSQTVGTIPRLNVHDRLKYLLFDL